MNAPQPSPPPRDRLVQLCREYNASDATVVIPLTRAELADRWGVSRGTVQRYLERRLANGEVLATTPLTLNVGAIVQRERPHLHLLVNDARDATDDDRPVTTAGPQHDTAPQPAWLAAIHDALVAAATAGHAETVLALETRLFERLSTERSPAPQDLRDSCATLRDPARDFCATSASGRVAGSSSEQELEGIRSYSAVSEVARPVAQDGRAKVAQDAAEALKAAGVLPEVVSVVVRRLAGGELRATGATPAWLRDQTWEAPVWSAHNVAELQRRWRDGFAGALEGDALLAVQLWPPDQVSTAVAVLAGDTGLRSPLGRMLEAAVWGYHKYFPPLPPPFSATHGSTPSVTPAAVRLWELSEAEAWFAGDPDLVVDHLRTLADRPGRDDAELLDILGIHLVKGSLPLAELEALDWHGWTSAEIAAAAERVGRSLGGGRS